MRRVGARGVMSFCTIALAVASAALATSVSEGPVPRLSGEHALFEPDENGSSFPASIAWDGDDYLAAWEDLRNGSRIYIANVDPEGGVSPPGGQILAPGQWSQTSPSIAWNGSTYLVTWADMRNGGTQHIYATRVSASGQVLDSQPIQVSTGLFRGSGPRVSWNGSLFLVVWQESQGFQDDVYMARLTSSGAVLEPGGVPLAHTDVSEVGPVVTSDGDNWFVVWMFNTLSRAARVSSNGVVLDQTPITLPPTNYQEEPEVAWNGLHYFVAWENWQSGENADDVYGARVGPNGVLVDTTAIPIAIGPGRQLLRVLDWDGGVFVVAWTDSRTTWGADALGARVSSPGVVLDQTPFVVSASPDHAERLSGSTPGPVGRTAMIYQRTSGEPPTTGRVVVRFADRGPIPSSGQSQPGTSFAVLHGTVDPNTQLSRAWFEWGPTPALGNSTPVQTVVPPAAVPITAQIQSLQPSTTYYYRVKTDNASGVNVGATRSFVTLSTAPPTGPPPGPPPPPALPPAPPPPPPPPQRVCKVPRVVGRTLRVARSQIARARCRVGRIRRARSRRARGRVIGQTPRGGRRVARGTRVNLVVSRGRR